MMTRSIFFVSAMIFTSLTYFFAADGMDRTVLPIHEPKRQTYTELDVRNTEPPARWEVKAPEGAPNVVVVLIDDMGFGVTETFGGPVPMPVFSQLANEGLRFTRFHTTALCAPTRAALLTGYNHHSNNMGSITETATTYPGNNSIRPESITPMAEVLRQNGFNTAFFGKCHEVPAWENLARRAAGPLAHAQRIREVLRLPRWGDQPVCAHGV